MTAAASCAPVVSAALRFRQGLVRAFWMALLWLGLNGLDGNSWMVGVPVVLAAAWISLMLSPSVSWRWSLRGLLVFAVYFLRESVHGGWDVAWRAIRTGLVLSPAIVCHPFRLPPGPSRLFFCSAISLLPGTAVVAIAESRVCVHVLDHSTSADEALQELERRVAGLFGLELMTRSVPDA